MTALLNSLKDIILLSSDINYTDSGWSAVFLFKNQESIDRIFSYIDALDDEVIIDFIDIADPDLDDIGINDKYPYKLTLKIDEVRNNFFSNSDSLMNYVIQQHSLINWDKKIILPFEPEINGNIFYYKEYLFVLNDLISFYSKHFYLDNSKNGFVLFSDKPIIVPISNNLTFDNFRKIFDKIDLCVFKEKLLDLRAFLDNETIEVHKKEKISIFILETAEILKSYDEHERFLKLIENFSKIGGSIQASFQSYLKNFSYQKLELELKKDLDYLVKSINDSLNSLQTQALGLPIATALTQLSKNSIDAISLIALIIFSIFVFLNSFQQQKQVEYIEISFDRFYDKDNVQSVVEKDEKLKNMKVLLDRRIGYIKIYIKIIYILSTIIILVSIISLLQDYLPNNDLELALDPFYKILKFYFIIQFL